MMLLCVKFDGSLSVEGATSISDIRCLVKVLCLKLVTSGFSDGAVF